MTYRCSTPRAPEHAQPWIGNRAPCVNCGHGLVACQRPTSEVLAATLAADMIYWRHDRHDLVLVYGTADGTWVDAPDQYGPKALAYRLAMEDDAARWRGER